MSDEQIKLNKVVYGVKSAKDLLDREFVEFLPKTYQINELFDVYNSLFYDISLRGPKSHQSIINESSKYAGFPRNSLLDQIDNLEEQIFNIKEDIDSIEDEHPFIKNFSVIQNRNDNQINYYMQSGRKRKINNDNAFRVIKKQTGYSSSPDSEFVILLNSSAIGGIISAPPINNLEDLNMSILDINRYRPSTSREIIKNQNNRRN